MWGYILIRKFKEQNNVYYYVVYKENKEHEINYYIGLDSNLKKIYFFENQTCIASFAVYDMQTDRFEELDEKFRKLLNGKVIMKALRTLKSNSFPNSISWEG